MVRLQINFAKTENMKYTSHLDLYRTWERTIRRAGLPLVYSQGFNPRPKINLAAALPLGLTSRCEIAEIWLEHLPSGNQVAAQLKASLPPGIEITGIEVVDPNGPKLPNLIQSAEYTITLIETVPDLSDCIEQLLNAETLVRKRREKTYDLRPLVESIEEIAPDKDGKQRFRMQLAARSGATGRPDEVLDELGISLCETQVERTRLVLN